MGYSHTGEKKYTWKIVWNMHNILLDGIFEAINILVEAGKFGAL